MDEISEIRIRNGFWQIALAWIFGLIFGLFIGINANLYLYLTGVLILTVGFENSKLKQSGFFVMLMAFLSAIISLIK